MSPTLAAFSSVISLIAGGLIGFFCSLKWAAKSMQKVFDKANQETLAADRARILLCSDLKKEIAAMGPGARLEMVEEIVDKKLELAYEAMQSKLHAAAEATAQNWRE